MDTHFVRQTSRSGGKASGLSRLFKIIRNFVPLFIIAAMLPILIGLVVVPPKLNFYTSADTTPELRVWFEPASVIVSKGHKVTLKVYAQFDSDTKLLPAISVPVRVTAGLSVSPSSVEYAVPFSGKTEIGQVVITAEATGESAVYTSKDNMQLTQYDSPIEIKTAEAQVTVR